MKGVNMTKNPVRFLTVLFLTSCALVPLNASAWDRGTVQKFATLPPGADRPEGLTADEHGNVYVTTFGLTAPAGTLGQLYVFDRNGQLVRNMAIQNSSPFLLGLAFNPVTGDLLVLDFGASNVLRVDPHSGSSTVFSAVPSPGASGLNGLAFDAAGNVYVSDSFQGIVWKIAPSGGAATAWVTSPLLLPHGIPPFGANGIAFDTERTALFVANTANDQLIRIPVSAGVPGTPEVFVNSINGADGIVIDDSDNIWAAANQADEIVVVDKTGKAIAKLGDFGGIDNCGAPIGLLFPASPALFDGWLYVTNFSLDLRVVGTGQAVDSQWAAQIRSNTVARLRARIPKIPE
jgi:sugar lactone lactonase YvrE